MTGKQPLLSIRDLRTRIRTDRGMIEPVAGVSFDVDRGETVCIVGESGCGKTVTVESITRILPMPPARIVEGEVCFDGVDLVSASTDKLREIRGNRISHVFQDPQESLNPVYTVGAQLREAIQAHRDVTDADAHERSIELLEEVGLPESASIVEQYPHELSGGMKQRVLIAIALAGDPDLVIADEPTTGVDVTIEAQILDLVRTLQAERDLAVLFVTHDLGVVAEIADRVIVMYAGKIMEMGDVFDIFERPAHPYSQALLRCLPGREESTPIAGRPPRLSDQLVGCRFSDRCAYAEDACRSGSQPPLVDVHTPDHRVSCLLYQDGHDASVIAPHDTDGSGAHIDGGGGGE